MNKRSSVMNKKAVLQSVVAVVVLIALASTAACVPAQSESVVEASTSDDVVSSAQQMLQEQIGRTQALRAVVVEDNASSVAATAEEVALDAHIERALAFMEAAAISAFVDATVEEEMERAIARGSSVAEVLASNEPVPSVQQLINDKIELALAGSAPRAHATTQPALDAHIERALAFIEAEANSSASSATESPAQQMLREQIERVRALQESEG
jgi:2-methylisocitrate lyase-like PEP mutase family enzyme